MSAADDPPFAAAEDAITYRAEWLLPVDRPPVRNGWVTVEHGRILECGPWPPGRAVTRVEDLGRVAVLPGLVNAHTHLELSWLRGRVPPAPTMPEWAATVMGLRRQVARDDPAAIEAAIGELRAGGTAAVGDVSNTLASVAPLAASALTAVVFHELLGFATTDGDAAIRHARATTPPAVPLAAPRVRVSLAPHAPYSVSPELFGAISRELQRCGGPPTTVHLAESADELELLQQGTGRWRTLLERLGVRRDGWEPPGCGPVEYLDRLGWLACRPLVVHAIHLDEEALRRLADAGATVVTCPRSAAWTGAGTPPVRRFFASGVRVAVGTDSLASAPDLNLFAELAELRRLAPEVPASRLLAAATLAGAEALGLERLHGAIAPGRSSSLIAVRLPGRAEDVEEYLVGGIAPSDVDWIDAAPAGPPAD